MGTQLIQLPAGTQLAHGGGTAIIYAAYDNADQARVALKIISLQSNVAAPPYHSLSREVHYAQILRHEHIAQCLGAFHAPNVDAFVIVSELVDGLDLLELLNRRESAFPEDEARKIFTQVLSAVSFLHEKGFVHRDLKPENVMIEQPSQKVKLVDFGLCKRFISAKTLVCGTPDYNPPEMIELPRDTHPSCGFPYDPAKVDVWALGVMLYMSVSGKYPFADKMQPQNVSMNLQNIQNGSYARLPSRLSAEVKDLVAACLRKSPRERITITDIKRHRWLTMTTSSSGAVDHKTQQSTQ